MQVKLKSGKMLDLSEEEIREMLHMYKDWTENSFNVEKLENYFTEMHAKGKLNTEMIADEDIESEKDLKHALAKVLRYGTNEDVADFIIEAIEMKTAYMVLQSMK